MYFLFLKMAITSYLPLIIGFSVAYVAGVVGLFFAFDGWPVFFSVIGFTFLIFGLLAYTIYRLVKSKIQEQMQNMQNMFSGMANTMVGEKKNVIDMVAQVKEVKDIAGNLLTTGVAVTATATGAAGVMAATTTDAEGHVKDIEAKVAETNDGQTQELTINPFNFFNSGAEGEGEGGDVGDIQDMMAQMMGNMTEEQKKAAEEMAMQMMQMFMGGGNGEGPDMKNLFGMDEKEAQQMLEDVTSQEQVTDVVVKDTELKK